MPRESAVRVGLVYPELLGTYGDRGNALVLAQRCHWRGQAAEIVEIAAGEPIPDSLDVYLFGGGDFPVPGIEDPNQGILLPLHKRYVAASEAKDG